MSKYANVRTRSYLLSLLALTPAVARCSDNSHATGGADASAESSLEDGGGDAEPGLDGTLDEGSVFDAGPDVEASLGIDASEAGQAVADASDGGAAVGDSGVDSGLGDAAIDASLAAQDGGADASADSGGDPCADATAPTFSNVYQCIFLENCKRCHGQMPPFGGSNFPMYSQAATYTNLVDAAAAGSACGATSFKRVVPGDADASLLFHKVHDTTPPCGAQMPFNGPYLPDPAVQQIHDWIQQGAQNN